MRAFEFSTFDQMLDGLGFMSDSCGDAAQSYAAKGDDGRANLWDDAQRAISAALQIANKAKDQFDAGREG